MAFSTHFDRFQLLPAVRLQRHGLKVRRSTQSQCSAGAYSARFQRARGCSPRLRFLNYASKAVVDTYITDTRGGDELEPEPATTDWGRELPSGCHTGLEVTASSSYACIGNEVDIKMISKMADLLILYFCNIQHKCVDTYIFNPHQRTAITSKSVQSLTTSPSPKARPHQA